MLFAAIPAAAGFINQASGLVHSAENWINPGAKRDEDRKERADWMRDAALRGSVLAAQIILAAPQNVSNNEDGFWVDAANAVQRENLSVWQAAVARGPFWPVGQPFEMPNQVAQIKAELAAMGSAAPGGVIHDGGPQGEAVVIRAGATTQNAANAAANKAGYQLVPSNVLWFAVALGAAYLVFRKR